MVAEAAQKSSLFFPDFFEGTHYFIDEKVTPLRFANEYKVYDATGISLGRIVQHVSPLHKVLRLFLKKQFFPFTFRLIDNHQKTLVTIHRGWTFWMSNIEVLDGEGERLGTITQKFRFLNSRFKIFRDRRKVAEINGDWKGWNFTIIDKEHMPIGTINKQWNGIAKELFTTADKYHVAINADYADQRSKMLIVAAAVTIDMVLKESR